MFDSRTHAWRSPPFSFHTLRFEMFSIRLSAAKENRITFLVGLGKIFGRSVKNFGRPEQFLKVWRKIRNVREKISEKMYGKKSRGSKILATRGRGDFVKFYLAPPKMRVAPQMPPKFRDMAPPLHILLLVY